MSIFFLFLRKRYNSYLQRHQSYIIIIIIYQSLKPAKPNHPPKPPLVGLIDDTPMHIEQITQVLDICPLLKKSNIILLSISITKGGGPITFLSYRNNYRKYIRPGYWRLLYPLLRCYYQTKKKKNKQTTSV